MTVQDGPSWNGQYPAGQATPEQAPPWPYYPAYPQPPRKPALNVWKAVAVIAVVLLLCSNLFWISTGYGKSNTGPSNAQTGPDLEYLELVRMDSLTSDYYQSIRENVGPQSPSWRVFGSGWQDSVEFCANLAKHDAGLVYWSEYDSQYYAQTGEHAYDVAVDKMDQVLSLAGVKPSDTDVRKIGEILAFVNDEVYYSPDLVEKFFAPMETLAYGSGDCDDYSILVASMLERVGITSAIAFLNNDDDDGHAMVLVHLDDLGSYGYYYYDDLTWAGLSAGRWIMIEPQELVQDQDDPVWFEQWHLNVAAEV